MFRKGRVQTGRAQQQPGAARVQLERLANTNYDEVGRCHPKIKDNVSCTVDEVLKVKL